jgi:hypothetical protein
VIELANAKPRAPHWVLESVRDSCPLRYVLLASHVETNLKDARIAFN